MVTIVAGGTSGESSIGLARADGVRPVVWAPVFLVLFGLLYLVSSWSLVSSGNFDDYAFGADSPRYVNGTGNSAFHPLTAKLLQVYRALLDLVSVDATPAVVKVPFAIAGALNVCVATVGFQTLFDRRRSLVYGATYGCTLVVWFFASIPESYVVTSLLYSVYLVAFFRGVRHGVTVRVGGVMVVALALAVLNDISALMLPVVPLTYYATRAWTESSLRKMAYAHVGAAVVAVGALALFVDSYGAHTTMVARLSPLASGSDVGLLRSVAQTLRNYLFFAIGAPTSTVTHAVPVYPGYVGFFEPSVTSYLHHPVSVAFLATYVVLISFVRVTRLTRLVLSLATLLVVRLVAIALFNPGESILYVSPVMLALLVCLFSFLEASESRFRTPVAATFAVVVAATNLRFIA